MNLLSVVGCNRRRGPLVLQGSDNSEGFGCVETRCMRKQTPLMRTCRVRDQQPVGMRVELYNMPQLLYFSAAVTACKHPTVASCACGLQGSRKRSRRSLSRVQAKVRQT